MPSSEIGKQKKNIQLNSTAHNAYAHQSHFMEKPGLNHEINLIKSFVIKERQQRYTGLLSTEKGRSKFRSYIAHFKDLNSQYCTRLPASVSQSVDLYNLLKSKGAPDTCYIISSNSSLDRKELLLKEATETLFHSGFDYFLSCIPGKLAYFEGEELGSFYLLQK